ncbi:MAG: alkaline phosphatase [Methanomassiliicoccales archaeon]|nr:MAG: alkaline phosphatase [Methanomassiliicoccales archaeon]
MMFAPATSPDPNADIRNVIMMIPDGCGDAHTTLARWYSSGPLALDSMPSGMIRTYGADSIISDSAPAATAFATGHKTSDKYVGVLPGTVTVPGVEVPSSDLMYSPVASLVEAAKAKGMSVGLVATANIQHATPAGFSAHWPDRGNYNVIAEQQVYMDLDVVFGGGSQYLLPISEGGKRTDGENLVNVLITRGYLYIDDRNELMSLDPENVEKVWGLFAPDAMAKDFDRSLPMNNGQPSLSEMTSKAIDILSRNPKGFFLMVEGSQVDWSSHANDPVGVVSETLAFDAAVKVALDFAKRDRHTMLLAFTDHGNGGMSIGNGYTDSTYSKLPLTKMLTPALMSAKVTGSGLYYLLPNDPTEQQVRDTVAAYYGITDLTVEEVQAIKAARAGPNNMDYVIGPMMSKRCSIGWTTTGHTGEDVTLYSYGPQRPIGLFENVEIAKLTAAALHLDLGKATKNLFIDANATFVSMGATVRFDVSDPANPVLVVEKPGLKTMRLHYHKDVITIDGKDIILNGVIIASPKVQKVWVPMDAVLLFQGKAKTSSQQGQTSIPLWYLGMDAESMGERSFTPLSAAFVVSGSVIVAMMTKW